MIKAIKIIAKVAICFVCLPVYAWIPNGQVVTITRLWMWENEGPPIFETSLGHRCYIPPNEKSMISLVLTLFTAGKKASIHCHDAEEAGWGGLTAHHVHRIVASAN